MATGLTLDKLESDRFKRITAGSGLTLVDQGVAGVSLTLSLLGANTIRANPTAVAAVPAEIPLALNTFVARSSSGNLAAQAITDFALTILDDADAAAVRATLGAGTGTVLSVTASSPLASSGGTTPEISISTTPTFAGLTLTAFSGIVKATAGVLSAAALTDADIPNDITLTNITQITTRSHTSLSDIGTLTHGTIDGYLDQAVKVASSPTHVGLTLSGLTASKPVFTGAGNALTSSGTVPADQGGTGLTTYAIGDLLYASGTGALSRLADVAAGGYLRSGGIGAAPVWSTLVLPNAATAYRLPVATGSNAIGELAAVGATGEYLKGNTGAIPSWATLNQAAVAGLTTADGPTFASLNVVGTATIGGTAFIGDTSNAKSTRGLTINQGAADDEILSLKSSDVNHGMTGITETDTFFRVAKANIDNGGVTLGALTGLTTAIILAGESTTDNTTKSAAGLGVIHILGRKKSGTSVDVIGADGNILSIGTAGGTTRFLFDVEGSAHADVEWTTFDGHDDVALLDAMDLEFNRRQTDPVRNAFGAFLDEHRATLQREKIVNFYDDGPRAMVNFTRLAMLHTGAIRQIAGKLDKTHRELQSVKQSIQDAP